MKISYNWLKQFLKLDKSPQEVSELLTGCGLEVEQLEQWESLKGGLKNIVVGHILTCVKHPNADKLSITTVDTGDAEPRQIVCGAPNVAAGQKVVVALPGSIMYPTTGEPFEIKKSKIRGESSEGMICAEDEIGLGTSHAGIMILPDNTKVGMPAADFFMIENDWVFEIGLTPNRADAASHLGVARDLFALDNSEDRTDLVLPEFRKLNTDLVSGLISVQINDAELCPRYSGVYISGVKVQESPTWLQNRLKSVGLRPINNIVDITNYVMLDLGQPLHAFDADKIKGDKIIVGTLPAEKKFKTLDGVERTLNGTELMIANSEDAMCIAGVFGGLDAGVSAETKNIFLESAFFNSVAVRKAARAHGLHTDSSFRFERGTDPEITVVALLKAVTLIEEIAGGKVANSIIDIYPKPFEWSKVQLSFEYLKTLAGDDIPREKVKSILRDLQIKIVEDNSDWLSLEVPPFKPDVNRPADIVEEIIRIYGYNAIALPKKMIINLAPARKPDAEFVVRRLGTWLVDHGFNEIMNNSLTRLSNLDLIPLKEGEEGVKVLNPLSNDLGLLRHEMLITGLDALAYNINRRQKDLCLFEVGKTYLKTGPVYSEQRRLAIFITGNLVSEHWKEKNVQPDVYFVKSMINALLESLGIDVRNKISLIEESHQALQQCLQINAKKKTIAVIGKVSKHILKAADINQPVFYAEINLDQLLQIIPNHDTKSPEPPKFPEVRRDLSMVLDLPIKYAEVEKVAYAADPKLIREVNLFDVYDGDKIEAGKKSYAMSFILSDDEATLQDKQIENVMEKLMKQFEKNFAAVIRKQ
jgi:phenylalanyl-tRNA synthetase beta chain